MSHCSQLQWHIWLLLSLVGQFDIALFSPFPCRSGLYCLIFSFPKEHCVPPRFPLWLPSLLTPFPHTPEPLLHLHALPRGPHSTSHGGAALMSGGGGTDFPYQHSSWPSVLDSSTLPLSEQGCYSEARTPSINPHILLHPDPFGQGSLKRQLLPHGWNKWGLCCQLNLSLFVYFDLR